MMANIAKDMAAAVGVMAMGIAGPAAAAQTQAATTPSQTPAPTTGEPDPAAVQRVADAVNAAIAGLPATASQQDVEAAIAFAISQQKEGTAVNLAALAFVAKQPGNQNRKIKGALASAQATARRGQSGTGGTGGASTNTATLGAGPTIGGGGVGVNYTTQN